MYNLFMAKYFKFIYINQLLEFKHHLKLYFLFTYFTKKADFKTFVFPVSEQKSIHYVKCFALYPKIITFVLKLYFEIIYFKIKNMK